VRPDVRRTTAVDRAVQRYAATLRQGSNPCRADGKSESQTENFRDAFERASLRYAQIKEVLCDSGVLVCRFVVYRSFGLHVDKLCRDYSGESLRLRVLDAIQRWTCYGCNPDVLRSITATVFFLDLPNPTESCKP
jgi:hypothetical protein